MTQSNPPFNKNSSNPRPPPSHPSAPPFLSTHRRTVSYSHAYKLKTPRSAVHHHHHHHHHHHSRRRTFAANAPISKLGSGSGPSKRSGPDNDKDDDDDNMAVSFLNFCAMCEKQIAIPDNSVLYCSASCRRKDSRKPLSASLAATASMSPSTTPPSSPPLSPRTIVAPMIPTRPVPTIRIPPAFHDAKTDLDPTEWKPVIPSPATGISTSLASSEAWQYLSQFHRSESAMLPVRRAGAGHRSSASLSTLMNANGTLPPLTHSTPSTVASSFGSNASDNMIYADPGYRPLPPRRNPSYSGGSSASRGVELVVPHVDITSETDAVTNVPNDNKKINDYDDSLFPVSGAPWEEEDLQEKESSLALSITPISREDEILGK